MLPLLCCWSALVGRLSVLECAFWGFLLLFALLHLFPLLRLFVTTCRSEGPNQLTYASVQAISAWYLISCSSLLLWKCGTCVTKRRNG